MSAVGNTSYILNDVTLIVSSLNNSSCFIFANFTMSIFTLRQTMIINCPHFVNAIKTNAISLTNRFSSLCPSLFDHQFLSRTINYRSQTYKIVDSSVRVGPRGVVLGGAESKVLNRAVQVTSGESMIGGLYPLRGIRGPPLQYF